MLYGKRNLYRTTDFTRPAGVAKVTAVSGSRLELTTADGKVLRNVGSSSGFKFTVGMHVTYLDRNGNYQALQLAPYGF